jgi:NAD(P) transhydrogenase subunit alpha
MTAETMTMFLYIFVFAILIGFEIISKVPPLLHTPLMSGSNAISGITIVGALLIAGISGDNSHALLNKILGLIALIFATINVVGGFLVTDRMLEMFKEDKKKEKKR